MKRDMNQQNRSERFLLVWAVVATLFALVTTVASAVLLYLHLRLSAVRHSAMPASSFGELQEDSVVGRYRWIEEGQDRGIMELLPDHSFLAPNGGRAPVHQWEIGRDALLVGWLSGMDRFTKIESPGVYIATRPDGQVVRMEKDQ